MIMNKKILKIILLIITFLSIFCVTSFAFYWNFKIVNANYVYENNIDVSSVTIAVIDSGFNYDHEDLQNINIVYPYNFTDDDTSDISDNHGHGTYVIGFISSIYNNNLGSDGLAYGAKIMPLKIYSKYVSPRVADVVKAVDYAIMHGADVINLSLGLEKDVESLRNVIYEAYRNGIIVVASVGNDGKTNLVYPAAYDFVVGVGSVNSKLEFSYHSRYNSSVFVTAPGELMLTTSIPGSDSYSFVSGTSFAAPHVSALAAVAKAYNKKINCDRFMELLKSTSTDLGEKGYDIYYGYGLIDFKNFINHMSAFDINYDGAVDTTDILVLKKVLINIYGELNERTFYASDVDHDGRISVTDYIYFKRKMIKLV